VKSRTKRKSACHPEPNPAAIIGGILALGVLRVLARADRERAQALPPAAQVSVISSRSPTQTNELN
jgi:hypothetical protein